MCYGLVSAKDLILMIAVLDVFFCLFAICKFTPDYPLGACFAVLYLVALMGIIAGHFLDNAYLYYPFLVFNGVMITLNQVMIFCLVYLLLFGSPSDKVGTLSEIAKDVTGTAYENALDMASLRVDENNVTFMILTSIAMLISIGSVLVYFEVAAWTAVDSIHKQDIYNIMAMGKTSVGAGELERLAGTPAEAVNMPCPSTTCDDDAAASTTRPGPSMKQQQSQKKKGHSTSVKIQRAKK